MTTTAHIRALAEEIRSHFEQATRGDDGPTYWRTKDNTPEWIRDDIVYPAHAEMFPDDWRYQFIVDALDALAEMDDDDDPSDVIYDAADQDVDVYTHALTDWLHSRNDRHDYCDEYDEEMGRDADATMFQRLQRGQYMERRETYGLVLAAIEQRADDDGDEEDE